MNLILNKKLKDQLNFKGKKVEISEKIQITHWEAELFKDENDLGIMLVHSLSKIIIPIFPIPEMDLSELDSVMNIIFDRIAEYLICEGIGPNEIQMVANEDVFSIFENEDPNPILEKAIANFQKTKFLKTNYLVDENILWAINYNQENKVMLELFDKKLKLDRPSRFLKNDPSELSEYFMMSDSFIQLANQYLKEEKHAKYSKMVVQASIVDPSNIELALAIFFNRIYHPEWKFHLKRIYKIHEDLLKSNNNSITKSEKNQITKKLYQIELIRIRMLCIEKKFTEAMKVFNKLKKYKIQDIINEQALEIYILAFSQDYKAIKQLKFNDQNKQIIANLAQVIVLFSQGDEEKAFEIMFKDKTLNKLFEKDENDIKIDDKFPELEIVDCNLLQIKELNSKYSKYISKS